MIYDYEIDSIKKLVDASGFKGPVKGSHHFCIWCYVSYKRNKINYVFQWANLTIVWVLGRIIIPEIFKKLGVSDVVIIVVLTWLFLWTLHNVFSDFSWSIFFRTSFKLTRGMLLVLFTAFMFCCGILYYKKIVLFFKKINLLYER